MSALASQTLGITRPSVDERPPVPVIFVAGLALATLIDLFATQAILPLIAARFAVDAAIASLAVNASTFGMAMGGLAVAAWGRRVEPRRGITSALLVLVVPTALLAWAPDLAIFAVLRVVQGVLMAGAFGLAMAYIGGRWTGAQAGTAFAAYVTGNILSNFIGRVFAAWVGGFAGAHLGFLIFAAVNLVGAIVIAARLRTLGAVAMQTSMSMETMRLALLGTSAMRGALVAGFAILFAFIGIFTFVGFRLLAPPFALNMAQSSAVYLVFLPALLTTPLAGKLATALGPSRAMTVYLGAALTGTLLVVLPNLVLLMSGLALIAAGTFGAQAITTSHLASISGDQREAASGAYLTSYFSGGLIGTILLGQAYVRFGWPACVAASAAALLVAGLAGVRFCRSTGDLQ